METERLIPLTEAEVRAEIEAAVAACGVPASDALTTREKILLHLDTAARGERRLVTLGELADAANVELTTAANHLSNLVRSGRAVRVKRGHYLPGAER